MSENFVNLRVRYGPIDSTHFFFSNKGFINKDITIKALQLRS